MDKTKIFINLTKCTEEEQKHVFTLLPDRQEHLQYRIDQYNTFLYLDNETGLWWVNGDTIPKNKTELTYPDFIKLFDDGDVENDGWINIESEKDLPKDEDEFWVFENNEVTKTKRKIGIDNNDYWWLNNITHYQPIVKPEPPKF